jgi:glycerate-2-kinase
MFIAFTAFETVIFAIAGALLSSRYPYTRQAPRYTSTSEPRKPRCAWILQALGESVITYPTPTNVNDFRAIFIVAQPDHL